MKIKKQAVALLACTLLSVGSLTALAQPAAAAGTAVSCPSSDRVKIREGSTGNSVREAQCRLNTTGAGLAVDGKFGPATDKAVRAFQSSRGLTADGVVGPKTWAALLAIGDSSRDAKARTVINFAAAQKGKKYVWGAEGPNTFDCSGLTLRAYQQIGITLPRTSAKQAAAVRKVATSERLIGDLMHWPGHVGVYAGNGKVWNASRSRGEVALVNVWGSPTYHRVF
ncbi:C40 family peptidase [Streptomyces olivaceus]|uniref:C40 family peptidase n=1 Tax=Streptomyces olivaceus TaxID=47716 RepID=UPI003813C749